MIRLSSPIRRAASVAAGLALLYGCAAQSADLPGARVRGHIATRPGRPGFVVAAPHGSGDGNNRSECAGQIEIATVGVDRELALRLRTLAELIRDAHLRSRREVQRLDVLVEPVDAVTYRAPGAKRDGILRVPERALHIELPKC